MLTHLMQASQKLLIISLLFFLFPYFDYGNNSNYLQVAISKTVIQIQVDKQYQQIMWYMQILQFALEKYNRTIFTFETFLKQHQLF